MFDNKIISLSSEHGIRRDVQGDSYIGGAGCLGIPYRQGIAYSINYLSSIK